MTISVTGLHSRSIGIQLLAMCLLAICVNTTLAGGFIGAGDGGLDIILHPSGYNGTGGTLTINVCQATTGVAGEPAKSEWEQDLRNIIAVYNNLQATTGNLKGLAASGSLDFESVALHELGHCLGKSHVNLASESSLVGSDQEFTKSTLGSNSTYDIAAGPDGEIGSADDVRGDDENLHWFWTGNNNPFMLDYDVIDSSNYSRDLLDLPVGDGYATNGDRTVADNLLNTPNTEAVMQQGTYSFEAQRSLTPDDVATIRYAMSGVDEIAGTADDYDINLQFATSNCDINVQFNQFNGLAYCSVGWFGSTNGNDDHHRIASATMNFDVDYNWHFNSDKPCTQTISLTQDEWKMFSLPCLVGISTGATVADILGDDLAGTYDVDWAVFERDAVADTYTQLSLASEMETGKGYWVKSLLASQSFDVEGQYPASPDMYLSGAAGGRWNMFGHPLDYSVSWSDAQVLDGPDMFSISSVNTTTEVSKEIHSWNGNTYVVSDDSTPGMEGTLESGKAYWIKVFKDALRLRVPTLPIALTEPTMTSVSNGTYPDKIVLTWTDPGEGANQIQINRWDRVDGGGCSGFPSDIYASVSGDTTTFEDTNPTEPLGHCYGVRACWGGEVYPRGDGCSAWTPLYIGTVAAAEAIQESVVLEEAVFAEASGESELTVESRRAHIKKMDHRKIREDGAWYVRIIAEADGMLDRGAVLGRLADSVDGKDSHDLEKRAPFGNSYLSVLFPHEEWGEDSWGFASDYRSLGEKSSDEWFFAVYVSDNVKQVSLSFEGPEEVLKKSKLTQVGIKGKAVTRKGKSYTFTPVPGYNYFTFRVDKK